jgi:riboflavin biosynthesis pyrimidine reductase
MLRLFPVAGAEQRTVEPEDAYSELALPARASGDRPYLVVNMVSTVDGQARIGENTDQLGNSADMQLFIKLREQVDCVMAGTTTIEAEQYKGPASKPETQEARTRSGLRPRPLFATVSRSGVLPISSPVFQDSEIEIIVFSEAELALGDAKASITQVNTDDPLEILKALHGQFGVRTVLLEGGPGINEAFFAAELVDELFLTVAPVLTGSAIPFPIISGTLRQSQKLHLISALLDEEHLFLRYRVD